MCMAMRVNADLCKVPRVVWLLEGLVKDSNPYRRANPVPLCTKSNNYFVLSTRCVRDATRLLCKYSL